MSVALAPGVVPSTSPTNGAPTNGAINGEAAPPKAEAPKEAPFSYKTKVRGGDNREVEIEFDKPKLDRTIVEHRDAVAKLAKYEKELAERRAFDKMLEQDPRAALAKRNINLDELALQRAQREAQLAELTPEQRRIVELEQAIAEKEESTKRAEQERLQQTEARRKQAFRQRTQQEVIESLKHVGMDITGKANAQTRGSMLSLAARIQARTIRAGRPPFTPQQLGAEVQKAWLGDATRISGLVAAAPEFRTKNAEFLRSHIDALTTGLEGGEFLNFFGPAFIRKVVQAQLAALQGGQQAQQTQQQTNQPNARIKPEDNVPLDIHAIRRKLQGL